MLIGHTYGLGFFKGDFKEKPLGLPSLLGDPGIQVPLSFLSLGLTCRVAALLGT